MTNVVSEEVRLERDGLHRRGIEMTGAVDHRQLVSGQWALRKDIHDRAVHCRRVPRLPVPFIVSSTRHEDTITSHESFGYRRHRGRRDG